MSHDERPDTDPVPPEDRDQDQPQTDKDHGDSAPLPFAPHKDDKTPLGDTDQHSDA